MLKVDINCFLKPILKPVNSLLVFPALRSLFKLILKLPVSIFKLSIFCQQRGIELIINLIKLINFLLQFFVLSLVVGQFILGLLQFLVLLVIGGEQLLILLFQLSVGYVCEAGWLVSDGFLVHRTATLLLWVGGFAALVVAVQVYS